MRFDAAVSGSVGRFQSYGLVGLYLFYTEDAQRCIIYCQCSCTHSVPSLCTSKLTCTGTQPVL